MIIQGCVFQTLNGFNWVIRYNPDSSDFVIKPNSASYPNFFALCDFSSMSFDDSDDFSRLFFGSFLVFVSSADSSRVQRYVNKFVGGTAA